MARAAMGAGDLAAPNSSLAGGPVGLTTFFLGTGFLAATRIGLAAEPPSCATITLGAPAATASAHKMLVERMPPLHLSDSQCCSSLRRTATHGKYRQVHCAAQRFFRAQRGPCRARAFTAASAAPAVSRIDATTFQPAKERPRKRQGASSQRITRVLARSLKRPPAPWESGREPPQVSGPGQSFHSAPA